MTVMFKRKKAGSRLMLRESGPGKSAAGRPALLKAVLLCFGLLLMLGGCGGEGEKTQSAIGMIQELDYAEALKVLDTAQEEGENLRMVNRARGIAYMGMTDYVQAAACFEEALAGSNGLVRDVDFDLNFYLAAAYTKSGRYSEAEPIYDAILALRPEEKDAYFLRGNVRLQLGNHDGAKEDFDKVVSLDPFNYDRVIEIHEVLDYFGYGEEGRTYLKAALETGEKLMDRYAVGRIYYYLGEYQSACLALEEAREKGGAESYLYLGKAYEATGDYNYAANVYNSYISRNGGTPEVYNQLGLCEMAKGEYQKALDAFQAGKQMENTTMLQTLSFNEIVAYEHLGEFGQACQLMETYLKNYPDDEQAKREQEFLSTR